MLADQKEAYSLRERGRERERERERGGGIRVLAGRIRVCISMGDIWGYIVPQSRKEKGKRGEKERMFWERGERARGRKTAGQ